MTEARQDPPAPEETTALPPAADSEPDAAAVAAPMEAAVAAAGPVAGTAPAAPPATGRLGWKRDLGLWVVVVFLAAAAGVAWRITHPPAPPGKGPVLPLRIMGAPQDYLRALPRPLNQATIRCEWVDARQHTVGQPTDLTTDAMGAVNVPYRADCALHLTITAPEFATREMWIEHPAAQRDSAPDWVLTLDRRGVGPRPVAVWVALKLPQKDQAPPPLAQVQLEFTIDAAGGDRRAPAGAPPPGPAQPAAPAALETPAAPVVALVQQPVTDAAGRALLTWLPNRGGTLRITVAGCRPFTRHFLDAFDFQRCYPDNTVLLEALPPGADKQR